MSSNVKDIVEMAVEQECINPRIFFSNPGDSRGLLGYPRILG
jgi:hypothetical protein